MATNNSTLDTMSGISKNPDGDKEGGSSAPMSTYDRGAKMKCALSPIIKSLTRVLNTVVDLLNKASLLPHGDDKIKNLRMVMELIVHKEINLLDNFIDEMLGFQTDRSVDVRKFVVTFIEEASKKDPEILPRIIGNLTMMLQDDSVQVAKKVILCMGQIYRVAFEWVAKSKSINFEMKQTWQYIQQLRSKIGDMLEVNNEGVRFYSVKFLECIITTLTRSSPNSELPKGMKHDVALEIVPENHSLMKVKKLEEDGKQAFDTLITYMTSQGISSTNLMTCMGSLTTIAKMRPTFFKRVLQNFEILHLNLPPHLTKSQVSSVRKNLKMQLLSLLKHSAGPDNQTDITTLLTDLGATQSEVNKALPKEDRKRKAAAKVEGGQAQKKTKTLPGETPLRDDEDDYLATPYVGLGSSSSSSSDKKSKAKGMAAMSEEQRQLCAINITAEDLIPRLTVQNVADLVLLSMVVLPDSMPAQFQSTYTPIAAAGTGAQIKHLAKLLATQLTTAGLGKGVEEVKLGKVEEEEEEEVAADSSPKHSIQTVVGGSSAPKAEQAEMEVTPAAMPPPTAIPVARRSGMPIRAFKLDGITHQMKTDDVDRHAINAFKRILKLEKQAHLGLMSPARTKLLVTLVAQFGGSLRDELENYIFEDLRTREDIAVAWIYQEFANAQGYNLTSMQLGPLQEKLNMNHYDLTLTRLLNGVMHKPDSREGLFSRLILESPSITSNAIQILKNYCQDESRIFLGMTTLKELILKRPCMQLEFLDVLLDFTSHEKAEVRNTAIRVTKKLHENGDLRDPIERYALYYLKLLLQPSPPGELFGPGKGREEPTQNWNEDTIKLCLYLYLGLLPVNHKLIHELAKVYTAASAEIKRTILRVLENPVKGMGMQSPELISLVDTCPKGAETLITRVIHILTENAPPSPELVDRVRDLYHKRVDDVRFLIPVLTGLTKKEVISALPQLIKLNPVVVKEVFNRLLGTQGVGHEQHKTPLTPADLLISLHNIDPAKCDMKTVIKATNLCFAEKEIYTQEVLLMVMQELTEQTPLPTLLMRTVLQSLAMWPKVIGLVLNILQRLVQKHVWKQKKVWEGFVKCCQRTKPHCFNVLLQLAASQLKSAFEIAPDLRAPLLKHVQSFTPHQQAHIPKAVMLVLEKDPAAEQQKEQERLAAQEKLYQQKLEEERRRQEKLKITIQPDKVEKAKEQMVSPVKQELSATQVTTEASS